MASFPRDFVSFNDPNYDKDLIIKKTSKISANILIIYKRDFFFVGITNKTSSRQKFFLSKCYYI